MKLLLIAASLLFNALPVLANEKWHVNTNTPTTASMTMVYFESKVSGMLSVYFDKNLNCHPEISFFIGDGVITKIGKYKGQKPSKNQMRIWVDDVQAWRGKVMNVKYSNGWDATGLADNALLEQLKSGNVAVVNTSPKLPKFVFPLINSRAAIETAQNNCG